MCKYGFVSIIKVLYLIITYCILNRDIKYYHMMMNYLFMIVWIFCRSVIDKLFYLMGILKVSCASMEYGIFFSFYRHFTIIKEIRNTKFLECSLEEGINIHYFNKTIFCMFLYKKQGYRGVMRKIHVTWQFFGARSPQGHFSLKK